MSTESWEKARKFFKAENVFVVVAKAALKRKQEYDKNFTSVEKVNKTKIVVTEQSLNFSNSTTRQVILDDSVVTMMPIPVIMKVMILL